MTDRMDQLNPHRVGALPLFFGVDDEQTGRLLDGWESSRIGVLRQYVRLMKSLVVFAENELTPEAAA